MPRSGSLLCVFLFFFNDTATTEIYTLSLHDALPIYRDDHLACRLAHRIHDVHSFAGRDRKSTRLNSSHLGISYAVFCLKKKKGSTHVPHAPVASGGRQRACCQERVQCAARVWLLFA